MTKTLRVLTLLSLALISLILSRDTGQTSWSSHSGTAAHPAAAFPILEPPKITASNPTPPIKKTVLLLFPNRFIFDHLAWERYRLQIIATAVGFAVLLLLMIFLAGLTHQLHITHLTLNELHAGLETQVQDRIAALSAANTALTAEAVERRRAEKALRESEARFRSYFELPLVGIASTSPEKGWLQANDCLCAMLGYSAQELAGLTWAELTHPDDLADDEAQFNRVLAGEIDTYALDKRFIRKDGTVIWTNLSVGCVRKPDRSVEYLVALLEDITERKQAKEALSQSEAQYRLLAENMIDVIWTMNPGGQFTYVSPSVERLRGYTPQEVLAQSPAEALTPAALQTMQAALMAVIPEVALGAKHYNLKPTVYELEQPRKDGSTVWTEALVRTLFDANGDFSGFLGVSRDITERKWAETTLAQAKERAETATRAKSEFLANMSHELRTPLSVILGFSELMTSDRNLSPEQQENLTIINRSGAHLLNLINDVLDMAKIEAGRITLQEHDFDLRRLLDELDALFRLRATAKGLMLHVTCDPDVPRFVHADESKLRQVLINLLGNAIKFTTEGSISLRVRRTEEAGICNLIFTVQDTGSGITPDDMAHIFEPFVQAVNGRMGQEGTGLGLSISQQFVRLMGGELTASSAGVSGQGSRFQFSVPMCLATDAESVESPKVSRAIGLEPGQGEYRLLVVDDRMESRKLLADLLAQLGFVVHTAKNGLQALKIWEEWQPHLIWMDMRMPVMDGREATRRIKATAQGQATIIIGVSASVLTEQRALMLADGCDDFVRKPFREDEIVGRLVKHLGVRMRYEAAAATNSETQTAPTSRDSI